MLSVRAKLELNYLLDQSDLGANYMCHTSCVQEAVEILYGSDDVETCETIKERLLHHARIIVRFGKCPYLHIMPTEEEAYRRWSEWSDGEHSKESKEVNSQIYNA